MKPETKFSVTRFNLNTVPFPTELRCVSVMVPDDDAYVRVLAGVVALMTQATNWEGAQDDRDEAARLCLNGYLETDWGGCMDCADVANCIETDTATQGAINTFISNAGGAIPGQTITDAQSLADITPDNIHTDEGCDLDAAWGAALYLTQSANRTIVDFFERTETLTETLERMTKLVGLIPAIGNTIENLAGFADELYDDLKENYSGAYDETYEDEVACEIFCLIKNDCGLNIDEIIQIFADRLSTFSPELFATVVTFIGTGTFAGQLTADAMFYLFFTALKFGQMFGTVLGIRPLTQLMGLGADQNASDNWMTLCDDCPTGFEAAVVYLLDRCGDGRAQTIEFTPGVAFDADAVQTALDGSYYLALRLPAGNWQVTLNSIAGTITPPPDTSQTAYAWFDTSLTLHAVTWNTPATPDDFGTQDTGQTSYAPFCSTEIWNALLFNQTPFSANFTVAAI